MGAGYEMLYCPLHQQFKEKYFWILLKCQMQSLSESNKSVLSKPVIKGKSEKKYFANI